MKKTMLFTALFISARFALAQQDPARDGDWNANSIEMKNTPEAEFMIRIGDVDNLNFGWEEGFDPFCGRVREAHGWPWEQEVDEVKGMDIILLSSKFSPGNGQGCGADGYSEFFNEMKSRPSSWTIPTSTIRGATVKDAWLQLFIDDFQSPSICSQFQITLNGTRFVEGEKYLNAIDQSGPVGKLITLKLPEDFFALLQGESISVKIDEALGVSDGWAVDFIKLIVNRKDQSICKGSIIGVVVDKETNEPIAGAIVYNSWNGSVVANASGEFAFANIPSGLELLRATAPGYLDGSVAADIAKGDENPAVTIYLEKGKSAEFNGQKITAGESVVMNKILFDQGKAELRPESISELDKITAFLKSNPQSEIELSGHTSSEGEAAMNRSLSYRRVKACKDFIVSKGIDTGRIVAVGFGPDKPVAGNETEAGRAQNRRVEMRVIKL